MKAGWATCSNVGDKECKHGKFVAASCPGVANGAGRVMWPKVDVGEAVDGTSTVSEAVQMLLH